MDPTADHIDASCRRPIKLLLAGAGFWILVGAVLTLFASIELHIPNFSNPIWSYGKLQAAQSSALLYGFGIQSILAVSLWMLCRIRGTPLTGAGLATIAGLFWNLALAVGIAGVLLGDNTGFDAFELPRYSAPILLASFLIIAFLAIKPFRRANAQSYGVSEWFLITALLCFGWAFSTATLFILLTPTRGIVQACIANWYAEDLRTVTFGLAGLASAFYFIPKTLGVPLHSRQLALFALWTLALFGAGGNIPNGAPFPAWIITASTVSSVLLTIPLLAVVLNLHRTVRYNFKQLDANRELRFICAGLVFWVIGIAQTIVAAIPSVNWLTSFTLFTAARTELFFWGFFALTLCGAIHIILPGIIGKQWPLARLTSLHFWGLLLGAFIVFMANLVGGIGQGFLLNNADIPFATVMKTMLLPMRIGTVGYLLIAIGILAFAVNLGAMLLQKPSAPVQTPTPSPQTPSPFHPPLYLALGLALILPWIAFVAAPLLQLGRLQPEKVTGNDTALYPQHRPGLAAQGAQIYRANGCAACHTQQVRPAELGSDLARGWGRRRSVARDYLFDTPPLIGSQRIGPDLANIGLRKNSDTLLLHLYNPQITVPKSIMPSYRFLFDVKRNNQQPSPDALKIAGRIEPGTEIVPGPNAKALVAYLQSLRSDTPIYEAPIATASRPPAVQSNSPTNSP